MTLDFKMHPIGTSKADLTIFWRQDQEAFSTPLQEAQMIRSSSGAKASFQTFYATAFLGCLLGPFFLIFFP